MPAKDSNVLNICLKKIVLVNITCWIFLFVVKVNVEKAFLSEQAGTWVNAYDGRYGLMYWKIMKKEEGVTMKVDTF